MDGVSFVFDQSLRGILGGMGPDELRHFVKFPKYLDEAPPNLQSYGGISTYPPAIYYQTVGWYDNDAARQRNAISFAEKVAKNHQLCLRSGTDKTKAFASEVIQR